MLRGGPEIGWPLSTVAESALNASQGVSTFSGSKQTATARLGIIEDNLFAVPVPRAPGR